MFLRHFILAIAVTLSLVTISKAMADPSTQFTENKAILRAHSNQRMLSQTQTVKGISRSSHQQETQVSIDASRLEEPHNLIIQANGAAQLSGHISINGVVIRRLTGREVRLDLSPYLSVGNQTVDIEGSYRPVNASVQITFAAPNSNILQQSSGTGILNYKLVLLAE